MAALPGADRVRLRSRNSSSAVIPSLSFNSRRSTTSLKSPDSDRVQQTALTPPSSGVATNSSKLCTDLMRPYPGGDLNAEMPFLMIVAKGGVAEMVSLACCTNYIEIGR